MNDQMAPAPSVVSGDDSRLPSPTITLVVLDEPGCEELDDVYAGLDALRRDHAVRLVICLSSRGLGRLSRSWAIERAVSCVMADAAGLPPLRKQMAASRLTAWLAGLAGLSAGVGERQAESAGLAFFGTVDRWGAWAAAAGVSLLPLSFLPETVSHLAARRDLFRGLSDADDGRRFINVYSQAKTSLGRMMSNFTPGPRPFATPEGDFLSVEGYWYFLRLPAAFSGRDELRHLSGYAAKELGRRLAGEVKGPSEADKTMGFSSPGRLAIDPTQLGEAAFRERIQYAIYAKVAAMPELAAALTRSSLPFVHYYVYGRGDAAKIIPGEGQWIIEYWEALRTFLRDQGV